MFENLGRPVRPGELLSGLPPGLDDRFLTVPLTDVHYFPGTAVPVVSARYLPRHSGLFVPEKYGRPPQPLDAVGTYIGGADFFGHAIPAETTVDHLRRITFPTMLKLCADLLRIADNAHGLSHGVDEQLRPLFGPTGWRRMQALCADGSRFLVAPQVVLMLLKYSALFSGDRLLPGVEEGAALIALLGTADDLGRQDEGDDGRRVITAGTPGLLERHVVAAHHFHAQMDLHHVLAKFVRQWKQYSTELAGRPRVVDLAAEFHKSLGIELDDFIAVGMTLYLASTWHGSVIPRQILHDLALKDRAAVDRILRLVACRPEELRAWARSTNSATTWDFGHLELHPVVDLDEQLMLVRPRWLLQRFFGWVPMYDILAHLGERAAAERRKKKVKACMEHLGEVYASETLHAQARRHGLRVHDEDALAHSLRPGRSAGRICDLTLDDGRRWALFEMTTSRLNRESATSASASRLDDDLTKLLGKIDQLHQTVAALRDNESALTGEPPIARGRRFFPVLVMTEGFPVNPVTLTALRERARDAGFLQEPDVAELEVVDGVELEILEGAGLGELSILDALDLKSHASLRRSNMRDFLLRECDINAVTPRRVHDLSHVATAIARRSLPSTARLTPERSQTRL